MRVIGNLIILAVIVGVLVWIVKKNEPKRATPVPERVETTLEEDHLGVEGSSSQIGEITLTPQAEPPPEETRPVIVEEVEVALGDESLVADLEERDEPLTTDQALVILRALKGSAE